MIQLDSIGLLQLSRWLVTYFVHSSLLLGAVWLVHRRLPALSETLWKTALLGGLLTATIQVGFGVESLSGTVHLATTKTGAPDTSPPPSPRSVATGCVSDGRQPIDLVPKHCLVKNHGQVRW